MGAEGGTVKVFVLGRERNLTQCLNCIAVDVDFPSDSFLIVSDNPYNGIRIKNCSRYVVDLHDSYHADLFIEGLSERFRIKIASGTAQGGELPAMRFEGILPF